MFSKIVTKLITFYFVDKIIDTQIATSSKRLLKEKYSVDTSLDTSTRNKKELLEKSTVDSDIDNARSILDRSDKRLFAEKSTADSTGKIIYYF